MTFIELLTVADQLYPSSVRYTKTDQTVTPPTTVKVKTKAEADYCHLAFVEVPLDCRIVAVQIRSGQPWQREYLPGELTQGQPDLTTGHSLADEPYVWQYYMLPVVQVQPTIP